MMDVNISLSYVAYRMAEDGSIGAYAAGGSRMWIVVAIGTRILTLRPKVEWVRNYWSCSFFICRDMWSSKGWVWRKRG
jgi:hypothetical protein